jgi:hypothetical protein
MVLDAVSGFKKRNKGLNNLAKFTDRKVMEAVETISL